MKIIVKPTKDIDCYHDVDGFVLPLEDFAVDYRNYYSLDDIKRISLETDKEVFVVMNKKFKSKELDKLEKILTQLDKLNITGIFFYDLALLELKSKLNLQTDLVWNNTHMVTNYYTANYYGDLGVKYVYLSNEITLEEILEINKRVQVIPIFMLLGYPVVAFSKRKLVSNSGFSNEVMITEPKSLQQYMVIESKEGTTFKYNKVRNNATILQSLIDSDFPYVYLIEDDIKHELFMKGVNLTRKFINLEISNELYVKSMRELFKGDTGFLYRKTIYKVKK